MPLTRAASFRSTSMPLCDSSTTNARAFVPHLIDHCLQVLFVNAEGPVGDQVARMRDRRVRKCLTDDRDQDAVYLAQRIGGKYRVAEIGGAHVLCDEIDPAGQVVLDDFLAPALRRR